MLLGGGVGGGGVGEGGGGVGGFTLIFLVTETFSTCCSSLWACFHGISGPPNRCNTSEIAKAQPKKFLTRSLGLGGLLGAGDAIRSS